MSKFTKLIKHPVLFFKDKIEKSRSQRFQIKKVKNKEQKQIDFIEPEYKFGNDKDVLIYMPWIKMHGDKIIKQINISTKYWIEPLKLVENFNEETKNFISQYSRTKPVDYRKLLLRHFVELKNKISGVILTFDWHPSMRMIASVCKELNITTYLVLHESVFLDINKYYWHESSNIKIPICDYIVTWGNLQKDIFMERGVDEKRIFPLGTPKLDIYNNYKPLLTKEEFCYVYNLESTKKIFLFAFQPMDVQVEQKNAIQKQREAINDLMDYCEKNDIQLILRESPAQVNTIFAEDRERVNLNENFVIDRSRNYLTPPEESIYHVDMVFSINSTMLFEAILMKKHAISTKYIEFEQIWNNIGLPFVTNKKELFELIDERISILAVPLENWQWAENNLSCGSFDGESAIRIKDFIESKIKKSKHEINQNKFYLFESQVDNIAISNTALLKDSGKYIPCLLKANRIITPKNTIEASSCDYYVQWGITPSETKENLRKLMKGFSKRPFIIEDGFIRSVGIGLSGEPGLSISLCGKTAYYDAYEESNFEKELNSDRIFTFYELERVRNVIKLIVENSISKYNDSPFLSEEIGRKDSHKVLVIDQRFGDQSVPAAMASEKDFQMMLLDAIKDNPESDIIIKRHPDAIKGGKGSYFDDAKVGFTKDIKNVFLIDYDIHPHQLLRISDKVYVCSSGLGFEALMYGKEVHCYGVPFYSNWGITIDKKKLGRRDKKRTLEEIFYISYIEYSRYYSPDLERNCGIEECINYIIEKKELNLINK